MSLIVAIESHNADKSAKWKKANWKNDQLLRLEILYINEIAWTLFDE